LNDGNCEKSNLKFDDLKLNENIVLIYNNAIKKEFKSMSRGVDLNSWSARNFLQYKDDRVLDVVALKREKNGKLSFHLLEYCNDKQIKDLSAKISEWTTEHKSLPIAVNIISLSCFIVLVVLFIRMEMARTSHFKCWMGYIVAGIIDYSLALYFAFSYEKFKYSNLYDPDDRDLLLDFFLYLYLCVEFAQIIWISIIFFQIFLTFAKTRMTINEISSKRLLIYNIFAYLTSLLITFIVHAANDFNTELLRFAIFSRITPGSSFDEITQEYVATIGMAEIITKSSCVIFYVLRCFFVWISKFGIKNVGVTINKPKSSFTKKYDTSLVSNFYLKFSIL
jgi:hypothetical protein